MQSYGCYPKRVGYCFERQNYRDARERSGEDQQTGLWHHPIVCDQGSKAFCYEGDKGQEAMEKIGGHMHDQECRELVIYKEKILLFLVS